LARDAIGLRPLYYCRVGDTFLFGSEIKALLAHSAVSARPNDDMLAAFLVGDRAQSCHGMTFFEGVSSVRPAHLAILTPEKFVTKQYWDFDPARQTRLASFRDYAEAFREHFTRAVRRRIRSAHPVAVSVSGGLDSSSIFCLAESLRRREPGCHPALLGVSYTTADDTPADEKAFLLDIERDYDVVIKRLPINQSSFANGAQGEVWHVEAPFLDPQWSTTQMYLNASYHLGARVVLTGHWGDQVLFDQAYLIDLFHQLRWGEVISHLRKFSHWCPDVGSRLFKRRFLLDLIRYHVPAGLAPSLRRLRAQLSPAIHDGLGYTEAFRNRGRRNASQPVRRGSSATAHARSLYQEARSSYHVLCMEWNNKVASMHGLEMALPFLDRDLVAFLMSTPGKMQTWKGMHKALLREGMRGTLPATITQRRGKADFTGIVNEGMEREYPHLLQSIERDAMAVQLGYLKGDIVKKEVARLKSHGLGVNNLIAWSLQDMFGLELWLRVFFDNKVTEKEIPNMQKHTERDDAGTDTIQSNGKDQTKKPYRSPRLLAYGDLGRLTAAKGGNKGDGGLPSTRQ